MECNRDYIICASVGAVCKLEGVLGFWDNGGDVSHDQPFKALHGYRCEWVGSHLGRLPYLTVPGHRDYGGDTDSDREWLKVLVKTLVSCPAHPRSTRPGNLSGPAAM